jgi:hypothetical protein
LRVPSGQYGILSRKSKRVAFLRLARVAVFDSLCRIIPVFSPQMAKISTND